MDTLIWINNVVTRYRIHLFDALARECKLRGLEFKGIFMAKHLPNRRFHKDLPRAQFQYEIASGEQWMFRSIPIHLNPTLVWTLFHHPPRYLIISGWQDITSLLLVMLLHHVKRRTTILMWAEANLHSIRHLRGPVAWFRKFVASRYDGFVVPGSIAVQTIAEFWGSEAKPFIRLPNLVSEELFCDYVQQLRETRSTLRSQWRILPQEKMLVCCARLLERDKGVIQFLSTVKNLWPTDIWLFIIGTGPDRLATRRWLRANGLEKVILVGQKKAPELAAFLAAADVFVLPSLNDPNPLAVVEAMWAGLPLFISKRCGNWPEAVKDGLNGWVFDPDEVVEVRTKFQEMVKASPANLETMGKQSQQYARLRFNTRECVINFLNRLIELGPMTKNPAI